MAKKGGNIQNLIIPTSEQARINGQKGGLKSAANYAKRKQMREELLELLKLPAEELDGLNNQTAGLVKMIKNWQESGDVRVGEFIRDTIGEKPVDKSKTEISGGNIEININRNAK